MNNIQSVQCKLYNIPLTMNIIYIVHCIQCIPDRRIPTYTFRIPDRGFYTVDM